MKVVDVHSISAYNIKGVSVRRRFCVYVRILTQSMRTSFVRGGDEVISFDERFRFRYDDVNRQSFDKPKLYAELWCRRMMGESCVAVMWVSLDELHFTRGETIALHLTGHFESRSACIDLALTAVNFPSLTGPPSSIALSNTTGVQTQQQQPQQPQQQATQPVMGIPLVDPDSAHSGQVAQYTPNPIPIVPAVAEALPASRAAAKEERGPCLPGPLPSPRAFTDLDLPPPNYPPEFYNDE